MVPDGRPPSLPPEPSRHFFAMMSLSVIFSRVNLFVDAINSKVLAVYIKTCVTSLL